MITRVYVDNYLTFQNFEWKPGRVALLMGKNGSGKSAVLDVLESLRAFVCGDRSVQEAFPAETCTRWDRRNTQTFELDVKMPATATEPQQELRYRLLIEHGNRGEARVASETLFAAWPLFQFDAGQVSLHNDQGDPGPEFAGNWRRSGLGMVVPGPSNKTLTWFKQWLGELLVLRPNPWSMEARAAGEDAILLRDCSNFAAWYRYVAQECPRDVVKAGDAVAQVIGGFKEMSIKVDDQRTGWLRATFDGPTGVPYVLRFGELSEGQRVMFLLYVALHTRLAGNRTVAMDEPDNFVSLDEIQPFLMAAMERALGTDGPQLLVISHHPESLNQLAPSYGHVLFRENGGPTRIKPFQADEALPPSEWVARGGLEQGLP